MFKAISTLSGAAALGLSTLYPPSALAACTTDTDSQWECLEINGTDHTAHTHMNGPYTFSGTASMYHSITGTISGCTLSVAGSVDVDTSGNRAYLELSNATSTGPNDCPKVSFSGLSWEAYDRYDGMLGIDGAFHGDVYNKHGMYHNAFGDLATVDIYYDSIFGKILVCSGALEDVEFGNDVTGVGDKYNPSFFRFSGTMDSCGIDLTLTTSGYIDVNAW